MARGRGTAATVLTMLATTLASAPAARAQVVAGGFDDASLPGRWEARLRIATLFEGTSAQFGGIDGTAGSSRVPLGARFTFDTLGAKQLPAIARAQQLLKDSMGLGVALSLGNVTTNARTLVTRVPLQLDLGITRRIALGVVVPIVRTRQDVNVRMNPTGTTGNIGFNPASATASGTSAATTAALAQNARLVAALGTAASALDAKVAQCMPNSTLPECSAANRAAITQLAARSRTVANGIALLYGTGTARAGALFAPIRGTNAQSAVDSLVHSLATQIAAFGVTAPSDTLVASRTRLGIAGLQRIVTDQAFGIAADTLRGVELAGIGDVELGASVMLLDTFGNAPLAPGAVRARSTVSAGVRLATGGSDFSYDFFDVSLGEGARALLLRSATDVAFGRKLAASFVARVESPMSAEQTVRIPTFAGEGLIPASRERVVEITGGRRVALELTPRWMPTEAFAVAAHYELRRRSADQVTGGSATVDTAGNALPAIDPSILAANTATRAQALGFGITYSTLAAFARGKSWAPVEVSYLHSSVVRGSGGIVPATRSDQLAIRIYAQLRGRSARRSAPASR